MLIIFLINFLIQIREYIFIIQQYEDKEIKNNMGDTVNKRNILVLFKKHTNLIL
jgi:hypothetical protein